MAHFWKTTVSVSPYFYGVAANTSTYLILILYFLPLFVFSSLISLCIILISLYIASNHLIRAMQSVMLCVFLCVFVHVLRDTVRAVCACVCASVRKNNNNTFLLFIFHFSVCLCETNMNHFINLAVWHGGIAAVWSHNKQWKSSKRSKYIYFFYFFFIHYYFVLWTWWSLSYIDLVNVILCFSRKKIQ